MGRFWQRLSVLLLAVVLLLGWTGKAIAQTQSPREVFEQAYNNRYTWDENFPGFIAEVSINYFGAVDQGTVRIKPDYSVEIINIEAPEIEDFIADQWRMEMIHRRPRPFEQLHGNSRFEWADIDDDGMMEIREIEPDNQVSAYQVKDGVITQVNRQFGEVAATVDTIGVTPSSDGYLAVQHIATFRDGETGKLLQQRDVRDFHYLIGNYRLLSYRAIRYGEAGQPVSQRVPDVVMTINAFQPLR